MGYLIYQTAAVIEFDARVDDAPAVRPPVNIVAQGYDAVLGTWPDRFEEGMEGRRTAVDVTDSDGALVHGGDGILMGKRMTPWTSWLLIISGIAPGDAVPAHKQLLIHQEWVSMSSWSQSSKAVVRSELPRSKVS